MQIRLRTETGLPEFLGIGALKAGTTYLDAMLRDHPEICLPPGGKEIQFFNRYFDRGPEWYRRQFHGCREGVKGEVSPQYMFDPKVAGRIKDLIPHARLVVSVRDPVMRAHSQFKHWVQERGYSNSFEQYLTEHPGAVERGRYFHLLRPYLHHFPRDQLLVILFEDLVGQRLTTMQNVYRFVGVDVGHVPAAAGKPVYASYSPRFHRAYIRAKKVSRRLRRSGLSNLVATGKRAGLERVFVPSASTTRFAPLLPETARRLAEGYAEDTAALSSFLGRDLADVWSTPDSGLPARSHLNP